jgi:cytochrome c oxidase cbb3-type subunit III
VSDKHQSGGVTTTGHVWDDDLADFTNQPPKWWMLGLTVSALWCVAYALYYPTIPISSGQGSFTKGLGNWTAISEMEADQGVVDAVRSKYEAKLAGMTPAAILADKELTEYVKRSGKVLFGDNCAACHGQNGVGARDKEGLIAPLLNDDDWMYGGQINAIYTSIVDGRNGMMPPHKDAMSEAELDTLAKAIAAGQPTSTPLFTEKNCIACHGPDGKGMQAMGSVNLTDSIWRFDSSVETIKAVIKYGVNSGDPKGRQAVMPSFKAAGKLSEADMKKLAVYVYQFGGGQPEEVAAVPAVPVETATAADPATTAEAAAAAPADAAPKQ